jgi:hypothetical protein
MSESTTVLIGEFPIQVTADTAEVIDGLDLSEGHLAHEASLVRLYLQNIVRKKILSTLELPERMLALATSMNISVEDATQRSIAALADLTPEGEFADYYHKMKLKSVAGTGGKKEDAVSKDTNGQPTKVPKLLPKLQYALSADKTDVFIHQEGRPLREGEQLLEE